VWNARHCHPCGRAGAADGDGRTLFPHRDLIVFVAFRVLLATLLLQGRTLCPLLPKPDLHDDDPVGREVTFARGAAYQAALASLDGEPSRLAKALEAAHEQVNGKAADAGPGAAADGLRLRAVNAARHALFAMRRSGEIGDAAFHHLEAAMHRIE
jgi:hypothetical protein